MKKQNTLQITLILGLFSLMSSISGSSVNLALPKISTALGVSNSASVWVLQTGLITTAILLVLFGHLGDLISKNFIFLYGGLIFIIGSTLSGLAPAFWLLLVGRVVQAVGSAMIMANSMGIVTDATNNQQRTEALATISMFTSVGSISGPALGGFLMAVFSWRGIFLFNVPFGLIVLFVGFRDLPTPHETLRAIRQSAHGSNWTGQNLFTIGMIIFFLSSQFFQGTTSNIFLGVVLLVVGGGITITAFIQDDRSKRPWISPQVMHNPTYMVSIATLFLTMMVNVFSNVLLTFYLQNYSGLSPLISGLIMGLQSVIMLCVSPLAGFLAGRIDRNLLALTGLIFLTISQVGYVLYPANLDWGRIIVPILINGFGMGFFLSPNNALTMSVVSHELSGVAGSFSSLARTLGMTTGISLASSVLFIQLPGVHQITRAVGPTFLRAFSNVFWLATGLSALAAILVIYRMIKARQQRSVTTAK